MVDTVAPLKVSDPFGLAFKKQADKKVHRDSVYTVAQWQMNIQHNTNYCKTISHGGGCCGIKHLRNFPTPDIMWQMEAEKAVVACLKSYPGQIIEAVLTQSQAQDKDFAWVKLLYRLGFKLKSANKNSNSQNSNFIFHLSSQPLAPSDSVLVKILELQPTLQGQELKND